MEASTSFCKSIHRYFSQDDIQLVSAVRGEVTEFEKCLLGSSLQYLLELMKHCGFEHQLMNAEVMVAVCQCLLCTVSCHSDPDTVLMAANALSYHAHHMPGWAPSQPLILAIARNMGLKDEYVPTEFRECKLPKCVRRCQKPGRGRSEYVQPHHVSQVLACMTELLWSDACWAGDSLDMLFVMVVAMLADANMRQMQLTLRLTSCLDRLLNTYPNVVWIDRHKLQYLVKVLWALPADTRPAVLTALPRLGRGLALRRVTAYACLESVINECQPGPPSPSRLPVSVTVGDVLSLVHGRCFPFSSKAELKSLLLTVTYADVAVGSERLPEEHRPQLKLLKNTLETQVNQAKDDIDDLQQLRMRLKELMTRVSCKWKCMIGEADQSVILRGAFDSQ